MVKKNAFLIVKRSKDAKMSKKVPSGQNCWQKLLAKTAGHPPTLALLTTPLDPHPPLSACWRAYIKRRPQICPDRPNFKSYCVLDRNFAVASRPGPFRPTFALPKKGAPAKNTNVALEGYNRFTRTSWVRAHGLIFGESYIVWVCAPPYRPLSSCRGRIRENGA